MTNLVIFEMDELADLICGRTVFDEKTNTLYMSSYCYEKGNY